jgi:hypothetical protein
MKLTPRILIRSERITNLQGPSRGDADGFQTVNFTLKQTFQSIMGGPVCLNTIKKLLRVF